MRFGQQEAEGLGESRKEDTLSTQLSAQQPLEGSSHLEALLSRGLQATQAGMGAAGKPWGEVKTKTQNSLCTRHRVLGRDSQRERST